MRRFAPAILCGALLAAAAPACAQENFEIQVYGAETIAPGQTMVELHSNVAVQGTTRKEDRVLATQGAFHETLEITRGFTPWFETGFYVFSSLQPDGGWYWVGDHIRPRVRAPESWDLPVGLGLSLEIGYQRREFSADTWSLELRPIIDKTSLTASVQLRSSTGAPRSADRGFEFAPAAKVVRRHAPGVTGLRHTPARGDRCERFIGHRTSNIRSSPWSISTSGRAGSSTGAGRSTLATVWPDPSHEILYYCPARRRGAC